MNAATDKSERHYAAPAGARRDALARLLVLIAYLAAIAVCTALDELLVAALLLVALLAAALVRALASRKRIGAVFIAANLALVIGVLVALGPEAAIGLMLAIAEAVVAALFWRSLRGPGPDIITRIACAIEPERSLPVLAYTRAVCWTWAGLMAAMAAASLVLTFTASPRLWWWWRLVGSWVIPVGFFVLEWLARQWILRREAQPGFRRTFRALPRIDYPHLFEP
ncbi:MAG: hypothetical protein ACRES9_03145 [Gammaproteobacteria bacterium]